MKRCNLDCQFLSEFDLFGKDPNFYFKGKPQRTSKFGKFLTYFYIVIYAGFFLYKIIRMLQKVDITFFESFAYSGIPSIRLTNDLFYGGFSLNGMIAPSLYYPVVLFWEGHRVNGEMIWDSPTPLELEICRIEKFGKKFQDIFKNKKLENLYCLKDVEKITLEGYSYLESQKYLQTLFYPCVDYGLDINGNPVSCESPELVQEFFKQGSITFNIEDIELTPHLYDTPSQPLEKDISGPAFQALYQKFYTYLQIVILETDKDVIGFEGLSDIETQQFLKYDESWIIAAPSPHMAGLIQGQPIADVSIQLSAKVLTQKRKNTKLIEVLGDVGGLMEVVWSFFNILASIITDMLYEKALINNLFSFDLDKKIIKLKKKKNLNENETIKMNDGPTIYNLNSKNEDAIIGKIKDQDSPEKIKSDELNKKFTNELPTTIKTKKRKKIKKKLTKVSTLSKTNECINKNLEEDQLKNQDDINIFNNSNRKDVNNKYDYGMPSENKFVNKETQSNKNNRQIIDRIKMNCCCIYFWFCFSRKKKNIQNALMDEGMDLVVETLDIMNVFKKIYNLNNMEETLKDNYMSENCKMKIDSLYQEFIKKQNKE